MTPISFDQLANIGIYAPSGATSFHTEAGKAVFLLGSTGQFVECALSTDAAERLMTLYKIGGTLGWEITGAGTTSEFLSSADSRETSRELMDAILYVAGGDEAVAVRVWEDPTEAEALAVWERVTNNGLTPSNEFCWGVSGSAWARELGVEAA